MSISDLDTARRKRAHDSGDHSRCDPAECQRWDPGRALDARLVDDRRLLLSIRDQARQSLLLDSDVVLEHLDRFLRTNRWVRADRKHLTGQSRRTP